MLPKHIIKRHPGNVASTMVAEYIKAFSPITIGEEDRIMFSKAETKRPTSAAAVSVAYAAVTMVLAI